MKGLLIAGGELDLSFAGKFLAGKSYDLVIGVDKGLEPLFFLGIKPDFIVGDLDSVNEQTLKAYRAMDGLSWDIHKPEKDETDMELALELALKKGCQTVDILAATGGRMDHFLTNIQLLYRFLTKGLTCLIYDPQNIIYVLEPVTDYVFDQDKVGDSYLSFIPFSQQVKGLSLKGFYYPLQDQTICLGTGLCVSNRLKQKKGYLSFTEGLLICIQSKD